MNSRTNARLSWFTSRWHAVALTITAGLLLVSFTAGQVYSQRGKSQQTHRTAAGQTSPDSIKTASEKPLSAWDIIEMTSWLFWPFVGLTAAGVMLLTLKSLQEYQDKTRSLPLTQSRIGVRDLNAVVRLLREVQASRASRLFHGILVTFQKTNKAEPIGNDIQTYLNTERESFETFHRVMGFLSDTAGALGLLGTVWGIFETFHGGKLDGPTILQGMSVSLVTTLVGLIISLVLNAGTTSVFSLFNKQLNLLAERAEELRQALLSLENRQAQSSRTVSNASHFVRKTRPTPPPSYRPPMDETYAESVSFSQDTDTVESSIAAAGDNGRGWL